MLAAATPASSCACAGSWGGSLHIGCSYTSSLMCWCRGIWWGLYIFLSLLLVFSYRGLCCLVISMVDNVLPVEPLSQQSFQVELDIESTQIAKAFLFFKWLY